MQDDLHSTPLKSFGTLTSSGHIETRPVEVEKHIHASPERVFEVWTRPDLVKDWWGPANFKCPTVRIQARKGGTFLFEMKSPDGDDIWSTGTYEEFEPGRKLVMTDYPSNAKGVILTAEEAGMKGPFPDEGEGLITVTFEALSDGDTLMKLRHDNLPARMHDECVEGWSSSLDKLVRVAETH